MSKNYEDYGYEDENDNINDSKSPLAKKILIVVLIVIAILVILYLIKGCTSNNNEDPGEKPSTFNYEDTILKAGKLYYDNNTNELPTSVGECNSVKLDKLIEKGLVNPENFSTCDLTSSYVRVCMLSNGNKQYTPWLTCSNKVSESEYGPSKEGSLNDVIADSTYVSFEFLPQVLKAEGATYGKIEELWKSDIKYSNYKTLATTTYYRFRDKLYTWNLTTNHYYTRNGETTNASSVNEYYVKAPANDYQMYDNATNEAYKWYKSDAVKVYYVGSNGAKAFSATQPEGFPYNEGGVDAYLQRYLNDTYSPYKYYVCAIDATSSTVVYQQGVVCGQGSNKNLTYEREIVYSCTNAKENPNESVIANKVNSASDTCYDYSDWKVLKESTCKVDNVTCKKVTLYNWFKYENNGERKYYPSGSSNASAESVYYTSAPAEGYVKDESTKAKAYKWFRTTTKTSTEYTAVAPSGYAKATKTNDYKWTDWSEWTTKSVKATDGRDRSIETKTKIKLQQITGASEQNWTSLTENDKYVSFDEMITLFKNNNFNVNTLSDINNNGEIRYQVKMLLRNKKEMN